MSLKMAVTGTQEMRSFGSDLLLVSSTHIPSPPENQVLRELLWTEEVIQLIR